jgi:uncharacterized SAM-binding protein YcdF (DUF218 family)
MELVSHIMFEFKKIITAFLMPLPALLLIGFLGLALVMFTRQHKIGCGFIFIALFAIFAASFQPISTSLLKPLERQYTAFLPTDKSLDYVMVLGSGHVIDPQIPPTSQLSRTALMRLNEGIRIMRMYPGSKLILSGYNGGTALSQARMMATVALSLGVSKSDIILLESAQDTWEEARQAAGFVGQSQMALVTSASHMERALFEFNSAGIDPIPAPTNYLAHSNIKQPWVKYAPQARYLEQTERYWHETLGKHWQTLRDLVSEE